MAGNDFVERNRGRYMVILYPGDRSEGDLSFFPLKSDLVEFLGYLNSLKIVARLEIFEYMAGRYRLVKTKQITTIEGGSHG